ncbi:MAG: T9SS type A sorting domain-containing protein, partial [Bacteroidota bacterium]
APYTYNWNTGATTATISNLAGGTYTVNVSDANGCTVIATAHIGGTTSDLSCTVRLVQEYSNSGNPDGVVEAWVDFGAPPYNFTWNTGAHAQILYDVGPGTYAVTVTDTQGCTTVCSLTIEDVCGPGKNITDAGSIGPNRVACGPNVALDTIGGGQSASGGDESCAIEYLWLYSYNSTTDVSNWIPIEGSNSESYHPGTITQTTWFIRCARRGECPYIESNPVRYEVGHTAVADIEGPNFACVGEPIVYSTPDFGAPGAFIWTFSGATNLDPNNTFNTVAFHTPGYQYVTLMIEREGCVSTDTLRVFVSDSPERCGGNLDNGNTTEFSTQQTQTEKVLGFTAYPNPAKAVLQVNMEQGYEMAGRVEFVRMDGATLQSHNLAAEQTQLNLDIQDVVPGLYLVRVIYDDGTTLLQKIVKQ